ncbi:MAG TPA: four helix bundle protein [Phycisphaerales bacterium]|nr:four helix bundle protein [Phycisphaerales bacterium]
MANVKRIDDLIAWQRAMSLCKDAHTVSSRLPDAERFGLRSQIRRSAASIPCNIAEGFGRESTSDPVRFLRGARGSLFGIRTRFQIAVELGMLPEDEVPTDPLDETDRVLHGLIRSLKDRIPP